jgi:hypothetical protein
MGRRHLRGGTCVALRGHERVATVAIDFGAGVDVRTRASRSCPVRLRWSILVLPADGPEPDRQRD